MTVFTNPFSSGHHGMARRVATAVLTFLMVFVSLPASAQNKWVSGSVTDSNGEPLIGVTVKIVGTTVGTATDIDGKYRLDGALGKELAFSYIGYQSMQVKATKNIIDVVLKV